MGLTRERKCGIQLRRVMMFEFRDARISKRATRTRLGWYVRASNAVTQHAD